MTRAHGVRTMMPRWMLGAVVCAMMLACQMFGKAGTEGTNSVSEAHAALLTEATTNYDYGPERAPVPVDTTYIRTPGGTLPTITISTATQISGTGRVAGNTFISRLTSSAAYPTLGLAPGVNYIWRDTSARRGLYRTLVVPADVSYPMHWLRRDNSVASYAPGSPSEPRLVKSLFGYGQCDVKCGPTHCAFQGVGDAFAVGDSVQIK